MERFYMAIATRTGYTVGMGTKHCTAKRMGDVRTFPTYAEADKAARYIADGKADGLYPGTYVSNR